MFYHVDGRAGSFQPDQLITPHLTILPGYVEESALHYYAGMFPSGISYFGGRQLFETMQTDLDRRKTLFELTAEYLRRAYYPDKFSRMQALFAYETIDDAQRMIDEHNIPQADVWEVEGEVGHRGDKFWLRHGHAAIYTGSAFTLVLGRRSVAFSVVGGIAPATGTRGAQSRVVVSATNPPVYFPKNIWGRSPTAFKDLSSSVCK